MPVWREEGSSEDRTRGESAASLRQSGVEHGRLAHFPRAKKHVERAL